MKSHVLYNQFHLGDCLIALHLVRALAKQNSDDQFIFFTNACNLPQLGEVVADLPNIFLFDFENPMWGQERHRAIDTWKNAGGAWEASPLRWDWSGYALWHHGVMAQKMGFESPFTCREHLLFDYPALQNGPLGVGYDILIVNSEPSSGQFKPMAEHGSGYLDALIEALFRAEKSIILTGYSPKMEQWAEIEEPRGEIFLLGGPSRFTLSQIGNLSLRCRHHIMIATGPMWPTLNTTNHHAHEGRRRIALLSNGEQLNMPHITQCANVEEVLLIAATEGWL